MGGSNWAATALVRILFLVTDAFGGAGGIACYNRDLIGAVSRIESVQAIRIMPRNGEKTVCDAGLHQAKGRRNKLVYSASTLFAAWRFRPDRIFCGHLFMLPLAAAIGYLTGAPVWLQLHGIEAWKRPSRTIIKSLRRVDLVTCVSRYTRKRFLEWANVDPIRVRVVPNTVADCYVPGNRDECRAAWQIGDELTMLTVGRLVAAESYKGQDRVIRCLPELLLTYPMLVYLIAGVGDDRGRLEQLAKTLKVTSAVRFLGEVDIEMMPSLYNAADLFIMPSTGEGFGIVYLEAMSCGTPAIGLNRDGSRDPLRDGILGTVTTEADLLESIRMVLATERDEKLAAKTKSIFGHAEFDRQVARLFDRMVNQTSVCAA